METCETLGCLDGWVLENRFTEFETEKRCPCCWLPEIPADCREWAVA